MVTTGHVTGLEKTLLEQLNGEAFHDPDLQGYYWPEDASMLEYLKTNHRQMRQFESESDCYLTMKQM